MSLGDLAVDITGDASGLGDDIKKSVEKGLGGAKGIALAGGAALAGSIAAGLAGALNFSAANAKLTAQLDLTASESASAGKVAGDLYAHNYGDSIGNVNEAIKSVSQNISDSLDPAALKTLSAEALNTASVFDQDLGGVTKAVGQLLKTGLATDAQQAFDIVTKGLQGPANKADDLLDTFNEYGVQFHKLGIDGTQALGLLSQGLQGGARDADLVADAFKEFSIRAVDGSKTTIDGYKQLGLSVNDTTEAIAHGGKGAAAATEQVLTKLREVEDPAKRAAIATELFGTQSEDLGKALFGLDLSSASKQMDDVAGAAGRVDKAIGNTASANIESFKRQAQLAFVNVFGNQVLPLFQVASTFLVGTLGPALTAVAGVLGNTLVPAFQATASLISSNQTTFTIIAGVITAALVPALIVLATTAVTSAAATVLAWATQTAAAVASGIRTDATLTLVAVQWAIGAAASLAGAAAMAAAWLIAIGPIALVIAAVVGLVFLVVKNWDTIKNATVAAWNAVVGAVKWAVGLVLTVITTYVGLWVGAFKGVVKVVALVAGFFGSMYSAVVGKVGALLSYVRGIPGQILSGFGNMGGLLTGAGRAVIEGFVNGIKSAAGAVQDALGGITSKLTSWKGPPAKDKKILKPSGQMVIDGFVQGLQSRFPHVEAVLTAFSDTLPVHIGNGLDAVVKQTEKSLTKLDAARAKVAAKLDTATSSLTDLKKASTDYAASIRDAVNASGNITAGNTKTFTGVRNSLAAAVKQAQDWSAAIAALTKMKLDPAFLQQIEAAGPAQGLATAKAVLQGGTAGVAELNKLAGQLDTTGKALGTSAAATFYDAGIKAGQGLVAGLQAQEKALDAQMQKLAKGMVATIKKELKIKSPSEVFAKEVGVPSAQGVARGIDRSLRIPQQAARNMGASIVFGPGSVQVSGVGDPERARTAGIITGGGVADVLARRQVAATINR